MTSLARYSTLARSAPPGRSAGLTAYTTLQRRQRLRPASARRAAGGAPGKNAAARGRAAGAATGLPKPPREFTPRVKRLVRERAGGGHAEDARCEACGIHLGEQGGQVHHRAGRGTGGCRDKVIQSCANAMLLCGTAFDGCHGRATRFDRHLRDDAAGAWIRHGTTAEFDPRNVAVMLHGEQSGLAAWLAEDGKGPDGSGYLMQPPEVMAA